MMITESISRLDLSSVERLVVVGLEEIERQHHFERAIRQEFGEIDGLPPVSVVLLKDATRNQPETVARGLMEAAVEGPIYVKDSDNRFQDCVVPDNSVTCYDLHALPAVNAGNKSYVSVNTEGVVVNIVEKRIISPTFCVGGYGFMSAEEYLNQWGLVKDRSDIYMSHLIYGLMLSGAQFRVRMATDYDDWGTLADWDRYKQHYCTVFIDLDGTLVYNSSRFGKPGWGQSNGIQDNIDAVNALYESGKAQIIITTSRGDQYRSATEAQLAGVGIKFHKVIYGIVHGSRIVVNDYARTNPYKSCEAINLKRDSSELRQMLEGVMGISI